MWRRRRGTPPTSAHDTALERVTGIEPAWPARKAMALEALLCWSDGYGLRLVLLRALLSRSRLVLFACRREIILPGPSHLAVKAAKHPAWRRKPEEEVASFLRSRRSGRR